MRDLEWLVPVAIIVAIEFVLWALAYMAGIAATPMIKFSGAVAYLFFAGVISVQFVVLLARMAIRREPHPLRQLRLLGRDNLPRIVLTIVAIQILTTSASVFAALKAGIPKIFPFWLDVPLAQFEHALFGMHAWQLSHALFGWATWAIDRVYSTFVPLQTLAIVVVALARPSELKSRALVTIALAWLVIGIFGAYLLSSAGPIFYDQVFGGDTFAPLTADLRQHAPIATYTASLLWSLYQLDVPFAANGISAMPSMHVAGTIWFALVIKNTRWAPGAWMYYLLIWLGSVHLGWHYFSDGLVASIAVIALWKLAPKLLFRPAWVQAASARAAREETTRLDDGEARA